MPELGPASADEMVLAFIKGEINSPKHGQNYVDSIRGRGLDRFALIDRADLRDVEANRDRENVLGDVRGYGRNDLLFRGFPADTTWQRGSFERSELIKLKYINSGDWPELPGGRLVHLGFEAAKDISGVRRTVERVQAGEPIGDLILVDDLRGHFVVLDGNHRATALLAAGAGKVRALIGTSPAMRQWHFI
jgi:hypothetical protein